MGYTDSSSSGSSNKDDRNLAIAVHLGTLVAATASAASLSFIVPLVALIVWGNRSPFLRAHITEVINLQITMFLVAMVGVIIAVPVAIFTLGIGLVAMIPLAVVVAIGFVLIQWVGGIVGALRASQGEGFRYPWNIRLIS
jgi:uncharacterized protein